MTHSALRPRLPTSLTSLLLASAAVATGWTLPAAAVDPPAVTATAPASVATDVPTNHTIITVAFTEPIVSFSGAGSFVITCASPCVDPVGSVALNAAKDVASFTLASGSTLDPDTRYNARVAGVQSRATGLKLAQPFAWHFQTGAMRDTTRPGVLLTDPATHAGPTTGVAANMAITAVFSEEIAPNSVGATSFSVTCEQPCASPAGSVSYHVGSRSAAFHPTAPLDPDTTYTARVTTHVTDLSGRALGGNGVPLPKASNYAWTFQTATAASPSTIDVRRMTPADDADHVCPQAAISATFTVPSGMRIDPARVNATTFTVKEAGQAVTFVTAASVIIDNLTGRIATFTPLAKLTPGTVYTARIRGGDTGATDQARVGNTLANAVAWNFTVRAANGSCAIAPELGAAAAFAVFGGNTTVTSDGLGTVVNGAVGVNATSTKITGLRDQGGNVYTVTTNNRGSVNGLVYTTSAPPGSPPGVAVAQASLDARAAFDSISPGSLPGGIDVSSLAQCPSCGGAGGGADELGGRTLPPGIYFSPTYDIGGAGRTTASLTLDGRGDPQAVWIFQTAAGTGTLNVGITGPATPAVPIKVRLVNGAQAGNIFWYVPGGASLGTGSTMAGTLLAEASITVSTTGGSPPTAVPTTVNGRVITLIAGITMTNAVINVPAP